MNEATALLIFLLAVALVLPLGSSLVAETPAASDTNSALATAQVQASAEPEIEKQREQAEQQAEESLDQDAVAAIKLSHMAVAAIAANKKDEAMTAIKQATGKVKILLDRNPQNALIPVEIEVKVIDTAPHEINAIDGMAKAALIAVDQRNFPAARIVLHSLMSEIRVRTYSLPLATYPAALNRAAHLLDQQKPEQAQTELSTALDTLDVAERVTPIPLILARAAIAAAEAERDRDKNAAQTLLETAKHELRRSQELGYAGDDPVYAGLNDDISNLEKQLKGKGDTNPVFAALREKLNSFLQRQSQQQRR
jgi:hypothetical protein